MPDRMWTLTTLFNYILLRMRFQTLNLVEMNKMGIWFHAILDVMLCQCMFRISVRLTSAFQEEILTGGSLGIIVGDLCNKLYWRLVPAIANGAMAVIFKGVG